MKEHPIIFSPDMVRAIIDGRKTQTRRVIKLAPVWFDENGKLKDTKYYRGEDHVKTIRWPSGDVGDRLWVREAWAIYESGLPAYRADGDDGLGWASPIYMPRYLSRITLEIIGVNVERIQDISHRDALAEGIAYDVSKPDGSPLVRYEKLWNQINAKRGHPWSRNPWVWAIEFKRVAG